MAARKFNLRSIAAVLAAFAITNVAKPPARAQSVFTAGHPTESAEGLAPDELPRTTISYTVTVRVDPATRALAGHLLLTWASPATEPLTTVPLHLYLNGFANEATTWMTGVGEIGRLDFDVDRETRAIPDPWGFIEIDHIAQLFSDVPGDEQPLSYEFIRPDDANSFDRTLAEVALAAPLEPGKSLQLRIEFHAQLPTPIARTGATPSYLHAGQWFPKIGVYEPPQSRGAELGRWAARQFHGPTEFYADFADWDVTIDAPDEFVVLATGTNQELQEPPAETGWRRVRYTQRAVHDFTFIAARDLHIERYPHVPLGGGPSIMITYATPSATRDHIARMRVAAETAFDVLGVRVGPYPYTTMTIVEPPLQAINTAGMEYSTFVTGAPGDPIFDWVPRRFSEIVIAHEIAHNYFQGMLATDEQREAFLDEGFAQFFDAVITTDLSSYRNWDSMLRLPHDPVESMRRAVERHRLGFREPVVHSPSYMYYPQTIGAQIYDRFALTLVTIERRFGSDALDCVLQTYFKRWRFRHPGVEDLLAISLEVGPPALAEFLREALTSVKPPDFAIDAMRSKPWTPPRGWVAAPGDARRLQRRDTADLETADLSFDLASVETDGKMVVEVIDPGWTDGAQHVAGQVTKCALAVRHEPSADQPNEGDGRKLYLSTLRVTGPGWRQLPTVIELHFADGVILTDSWDGRATWREYRVIRLAPLTAAYIDPENQVSVDIQPDNNRRRLKPTTVLGDGVAVWIGMLTQWLALSLAGL